MKRTSVSCGTTSSDLIYEYLEFLNKGGGAENKFEEKRPKIVQTESEPQTHRSKKLSKFQKHEESNTKAHHN